MQISHRSDGGIMTYPITLPDVLTQHNYVGVMTYRDAGDHIDEITAWCKAENVLADFVGMWMVVGDNSILLWKVPDEKQKILFALKWS